MTHEVWITALGLGAASFAIRLGGYLLARQLPQKGAWARGMKALPGSLIVALVTLMMVNGGPIEWAAGALALGAALVTRNVPLSMLVGIVAVAVMRANF